MDGIICVTVEKRFAKITLIEDRVRNSNTLVQHFCLDCPNAE